MLVVADETLVASPLVHVLWLLLMSPPCLHVIFLTMFLCCKYFDIGKLL
uniref:Uncharacterized protein n=1 Tax=Ciona intestinalis TaxID=7719 RepID=H2XNV7_CIOIN